MVPGVSEGGGFRPRLGTSGGPWGEPEQVPGCTPSRALGLLVPQCPCKLLTESVGWEGQQEGCMAKGRVEVAMAGDSETFSWPPSQL